MDTVGIILLVFLYMILCFVYFAMIFLSRAISVFSYVMQGLGLFTMARNRGIENPWLAWVPMANTWLLGKVSDQYREKVTGEDPNLRKKLLIRKIVWIATTLLMVGLVLLWYFGMIFGIIFTEAFYMDSEALLEPMVLVLYIALLVWLVAYTVTAVFYFISQYKALFDLYRSSDPKTSTAFFVLSFFSQIALTLGIFLNRNKTLGMPSEPVEISAEE